MGDARGPRREHDAHGFPFLDGKQRFALFAEQVEIVVASWNGKRFDHDGPEVNTLGAPNDELRERKARLDRACADAGRDPATLGYSVMT